MAKKLDPEVQARIDKVLFELSHPQSPGQESRNWKDPKGYQYLAAWQNAALLRVLVRMFTETLSEYLTFLGYSQALYQYGTGQASLEELRGDVRDCKTDGYLKSVPGSSLIGIGIDLRVIKGPS